MIPKIIHQIWIGPKPAPTKWMQTWRDKNPDWQYKLWDNECVATTSWKCQAQIDAMHELNGKADILRYEILEREGGLCFDADSECVQPLDDHFLEHEAFACYEHEVCRPGLIATGYLGTVVGSQLMAEAIKRIDRGINVNEKAWVSVGPAFFTDLVRDTKASIHVYPSRTFIPEHWTGNPAPGDAPVYAKQFWGSTLGYPNG